MLYRADWIFPGDGPPIRDGWIRVEGDRITATGSASGLPAGLASNEVRRFEGCSILPGLVNAHCHLELTGFEGTLDPGASFPAWVGQLRSRAAASPPDYAAAARAGVRQLLAGGCTTVLDVGNTGAALAALAESPLRAIACVETLGQDPALASARFEAARAVASLGGKYPASDRFRPGLAPHAAYSCSPDLLRLLIDEQKKRGLPVTLHAAESREEADLFASGTGSLAEYCRSIFPQAQWPKGTTTIRWLDSQRLLPDGVLIVHGNLLEDADMDILARRKATVVHCPSSHAFFGHPRFPYEKLRERGIPVCLGTDSLASGDSLSMLEQMRLFSENYPGVPVEEVVRMATVNGARALGLGDQIGMLKAGYRADFVAVKADAGFPGKSPGTSAHIRLVSIDGHQFSLAAYTR